MTLKRSKYERAKAGRLAEEWPLRAEHLALPRGRCRRSPLQRAQPVRRSQDRGRALFPI